MNTRLPAFILVSLLAHAMLLLRPDEHARPVLAIGGQAQALKVTLAGPAAPAEREVAAMEMAATVREPAHTPPVRQGETPRPRKREQIRQATAKPPVEIPPGRLPAAGNRRAAPPAPTAASNRHVSERISAALRKQLSKRFEYPWLARKRGWQGEVTLSLQVEDNGDLTHWRVSKTSGYALLDRSALKAARSIGRLQEADGLLHGESLNLRIPVRYRLLDS